MVNNDKKMVIAAVIIGLLYIVTGICLHLYREHQRCPLPAWGWNPSIEDVSWMEKGTVTGEDTCLVADWNRYKAFKVIPGKYVYFTEYKGTMERLEGDLSKRNLYYWKRIQTNIYDVTSGKLVQNIDVKKLVKKHAPDFQYDGMTPVAFSGENGHVFLQWFLDNIPEDGDHKYTSKQLCMDCDTGKIYSDRELETLYDDIKKQENFIGQFEESVAKAFLEENEYAEFTTSKSDSKRACEYTYYPSVNGVANIDIAATALPKENEALYTRFPGLQEYQGEEGKVVRIYLGGYPTIEEIHQLIVEEGISE